MTTTRLREHLDLRQKRYDYQRAQVEVIQARADRAKALATTAIEYAKACEEASVLLASYSDKRQEEVLVSIQTIVSAGLTAVFNEEIELRLTQTVRGRRPEIDITVVTGDLETSILDARGGGLAQVAGLLLKITTLLLTRGARRLIVADEPLGMLSAEYAPRVAEFLAELCEKTDLQLLMVTHDDALAEAADRVIRLKTVNGEAKAIIEK